MAKKQSSKKPSKKTAKAPKVDAAVPATRPESKPRKARERDSRLPAAGTVIVRTYKGQDYRVKVLEDSFELDGKTYRSLTALARAVTGYAAISGPAWLGIAERKDATPKPESPKEKPVAPTKGRAPKVRRAGRDAPTAAPKEDAPQTAPVAETPAA